MHILQKPGFQRTYKKLHLSQRSAVDAVIRDIAANPVLGDAKTGDLMGVRVYKFRILQQLVLLAYTCDQDIVTLLALGNHENFYRDLKKSS
jgi:mRNA interferase RelE/StbE